MTRGRVTSAEGEREVPGGAVFWVGVAREQRVAFQKEAGVAAVPHFVPDAERRPLLDPVLQPSRVSARVTW